jgi:hypothetical protein
VLLAQAEEAAGLDDHCGDLAILIDYQITDGANGLAV